MTGCIDKGDLLPLVIDLVSTDVLSDPAGFAFNHVGFAYRIEQCGLAMVDMTQDADDGRAGLEKLRVVVVGLFNFWLRPAFFGLLATVVDL